MRIRWRGLELPARVQREPRTATEQYAKFSAEPFERGFGTTVGNALRRILLSSLEGAAVTHVRLKGADHEFMSLPGVMEDVTDIILNVKALIVRLEGDDTKEITIRADKQGAITAGQAEGDPAVEVVNPDLVLATLTEDVEFEMTLRIGKGRGYVTAAEHLAEEIDQEHGVIAVDSDYSPVLRVRYDTEDARVGQKTDYDRLVLEVWTNGTITPEMALVEASKILRKHLNPFVQYFELGEDLATEESVASLSDTGKTVIDPDLQNKLNLSVQELDLSVRANNCLESARINTVRDLVKMSDADLLKVRSFGKTSLREVKRRLADLGLSLGMDLDAVPQQSQVAAYAELDDDDDDADDLDETDGVETASDVDAPEGVAQTEAASYPPEPDDDADEELPEALGATGDADDDGAAEPDLTQEDVPEEPRAGG